MAALSALNPSLESSLRGLLAFSFPKRLPAEFGGRRITVTPRADVRVLRRGWKRSAHDLMLVARSLVRSGMTVWDLGANMGIFSAMAAFRAGPDGQVFAIDADPRYADLVQRNGARLGPRYAPIRALCTAISGRSGVAEFASSTKGHARNHLLLGRQDRDAAGTRLVPTLRADDLLSVFGEPDVVKVDVEGAELLFLEGAEDLLTRARPILYIEVNEDNAGRAGRMLERYGYDLFHLKGDGSERPVEQPTFYTIARPRNDRAG